MSAIKFFGENHLQLSNIIAARIGRGIKELPSIKGYASSIVIAATTSTSSRQILEPMFLGVFVSTWRDPTGPAACVALVDVGRHYRHG